MCRKSALMAVMAVIICAGGWLFGDDPKAAPAKNRKTLPTYWSKLGLSNEQKQRVFAIQAEYGAKIDALQQQVKSLQKDERDELERILTPEQKKQLLEIVAGKALIDGAGKDEKKSDEKKK